MEGDWIWSTGVFPDSFLAPGPGWGGAGRLAGGTVLVLRSVCFLGTGGGREEETPVPGLAGSLVLLLATLCVGMDVKGFPGDLNS